MYSKVALSLHWSYTAEESWGTFPCIQSVHAREHSPLGLLTEQICSALSLNFLSSWLESSLWTGSRTTYFCHKISLFRKSLEHPKTQSQISWFCLVNLGTYLHTCFCLLLVLHLAFTNSISYHNNCISYPLF